MANTERIVDRIGLLLLLIVGSLFAIRFGAMVGVPASFLRVFLLLGALAALGAVAAIAYVVADLLRSHFRQ